MRSCWKLYAVQGNLVRALSFERKYPVLSTRSKPFLTTRHEASISIARQRAENEDEADS